MKRQAITVLLLAALTGCAIIPELLAAGTLERAKCAIGLLLLPVMGRRS